MFKILSSWRRVFVYLALICLITFVGSVGGWIMGLVFGLVLSLLIELFSFIREETVNSIEKHISLFSQTVRDQISTLADFRVLKEDLKNLNIEFNSSALTKILDLHGTGLREKLTPVFLFNPSVEPNIVIHKPCVTILLLNPTPSISLFVRLFDFVNKSYWGTSFTKPETWEFAPIEKEAMEKQKNLIEKGIEVKRVFILAEEDPKEKVIKRCETQVKEYKIACRYITLNKIRGKPPLQEVWQQLWSNFLGQAQINKFILLSPDFGIIDGEILVSFLMDLNRSHIGAAVFFKPDFLDQLMEYYQHLFEESEVVK